MEYSQSKRETFLDLSYFYSQVSQVVLVEDAFFRMAPSIHREYHQ
jgi:hypothetical protein